jgi:thiamine-phosphate pyrophosphorylase
LKSAIRIPRFYPILDASRFSSASDNVEAVVRFALELVAGGASLIQYRNKSGRSPEILVHGRELRRAVGDRATLIMNDRADLCLSAAFDGVHLGQDDLSPDAVRRIFQEAGASNLWIGFSTHNPDQIRQVERMPVDYVAIGPVFATNSKANPDPVVGLEGVRLARQLTSKPLVAIGGITRQNCAEVMTAGADAVAVIGDVVKSPRKSTEEFLGILG